MKKETSIKELAKNLVGDGKSPNKYFVTIAYGWYRPKGEEEMKQVGNSLDSVTVLFTSRPDAEQFFENIPMCAASIDEVTKETIGQIILEDRKTGVLMEKCIYQRDNGTFNIDTWQ